MAKAYTLIQAQTLSATTASVTFSNIPQNYTDLIVKISGRATAGTGTSRAIQLQINGDTTYANYRQRYLRTDDTGAAQAGAFLSSTGLRYYFYGLPNANVTANSFGAAELTFINYAGSSYKTFSVEAFAEGFHNPFTGTAGNSITAALWVNTSPITTLVFNPDDSSFAAGSTFYLYGIGGARATGGTIAYDANYTYHTFTSTSTFTPLEKIKNAEILLVAGGGGGASGAGGPGGGAGGVISYTGQTFFAGTSYTASVGAGGTAGTSGPSRVDGLNGNNSSLASLSAIGGGKGGETSAAGNGGSGGGGATDFVAGTGTAGQGNNGARSASTAYGGGGGGAGGVGLAVGGGGSLGGPGTNAYSTWAAVTNTGSNGFYGGGGGGGANIQFQSGIPSPGGIGGGGTANNTSTAGSGTANTGSGGGGGSYQSSTYGAGGAGGSGLIIIRYPSI